MKAFFALCVLCTFGLALSQTEPSDSDRTTRQMDTTTARDRMTIGTDRPTLELPSDGTVPVRCRNTDIRAVADCSCCVQYDADGCGICPDDCRSRCPERRQCDRICPNGFRTDSDCCQQCECRTVDSGNEGDVQCRPRCITPDSMTYCNRTCNSTVNVRDECDRTRPCTNGRCDIVDIDNSQRCVVLPGEDEMCLRYNPVDDGTREDDDFDNEREMDRYSDDLNDRSRVQSITRDEYQCAEGLICSESRVCVRPTGPCITMRETDSEVNCEEDGNFDARQCRQRDNRMVCWCARSDGTEEQGTRRNVDNEIEFSRTDCVRRVYQNCSVMIRRRMYQVLHGRSYLNETDTGCRECQCSNGVAARCRDIEAARCPTRDQERQCTFPNGTTIANGQKTTRGRCNRCKCVDGDLQCTDISDCRGDDDSDVSMEDKMCRMCASKSRKTMCGSDGKNYDNECEAKYCGRFAEADIISGPCANVDVCAIRPCGNNTCVENGGVSCIGRCFDSEPRSCVNMSSLRCTADITLEGDRVVCGSDGRSYTSKCHMIKLGPARVRVAHTGKCNRMECANNMVCGTDGVTYPSSCHIRTLYANARIDHNGTCEEDPTGNRTQGQLCENTRSKDRCPRPTCKNRAMPGKGCCPVCGGIVTIALDDRRITEEKAATGKRYGGDEIVQELIDSGLITEMDRQKCEIRNSLLTKSRQTNLEIVFEAKSMDDSEICMMASDTFVKTLNSTAVTLPPIASSVSAAVSTLPLVDDSGAPALTASYLAVMMATIFVALTHLF